MLQVCFGRGYRLRYDGLGTAALGRPGYLTLAHGDSPALGSADALAQVLAHLERMITHGVVAELLLKHNDKRGAFRAGLDGRDGFAS